jgi:hypothetical protein
MRGYPLIREVTNHEHIEVLRELRKLIDQSAGSPIVLASGATRSFRQKRTFDPAAVTELEHSIGVRFPSEYSRLLAIVGSAECFVDDAGWPAI